MPVYRISPEAARLEKQALRKRWLMISAIMMAGTLLVPLTFISRGWAVVLSSWISGAVVVALLCVHNIRRMERLEDEACASFEFTWDGETVGKAQRNTPDV